MCPVQDRRPENGSYPRANQPSSPLPSFPFTPALPPLYGTLFPHDQPPHSPPPFLREFPDCPWAWTQIETKKPGRKDVRLGTFSTLNFTATPRPFFFRVAIFLDSREFIQLLLPFLSLSPPPLARSRARVPLPWVLTRQRALMIQ